MKIPNKIKIAGIHHLIEINKERLFDKDNNPVDGRVCIDEQKIKFDFAKVAKNEFKELVFLHEITHLLFYYSGLGNSELWNKEDEVHKFSVLLHSFLKDNKLLK